MLSICVRTQQHSTSASSFHLNWIALGHLLQHNRNRMNDYCASHFYGDKKKKIMEIVINSTFFLTNPIIGITISSHK